ncbi:hypothetical protein ML575_004671 [Escherichia coli]|uniref:hypothetical protein n=1 Tax=Escherichia coli TaxID=562 RepID=UPI000B7FE37A|nr:hypothetical protein [Escherichia coli]EIY0410254.1 hypothetical protein [Escherichia coli]MCR6171693.1 hypothetical protein [Escherichia coli]HBB8986060.1 hypothetical protein [Escherichia coli]
MYKLDENEAKKIVGGEERCWIETYSNDGKGNCVRKQICHNVDKNGNIQGNDYVKKTYSESCPVTGQPITYPT